MPNKKTEEEKQSATTSGISPKKTEAARSYIYVGPSLPSGRLRENALLRGSPGSIHKMFAEEIKAYPQIKHLIVPVETLGAFLPRLRTPGNLAYRHYQEIKTTARPAVPEKEGDNHAV